MAAKKRTKTQEAAATKKAAAPKKSTTKKAAPKKAVVKKAVVKTAAVKKAPALRLSPKQKDLLKKVAAALEGLVTEDKIEEKSLKTLQAKKLLKKAKNQAGIAAFMITAAGKKYAGAAP